MDGWKGLLPLFLLKWVSNAFLVWDRQGLSCRGSSSLRAFSCQLCTVSGHPLRFSKSSGQPIEAFKKAIPSGGHTGFHEPLSSGTQLFQVQLWSDLIHTHGFGQILLVRENQQNGIVQFRCLQHLLDFSLDQRDPFMIRTVHHKDKAAGALKVKPPNLSGLLLSANIPHNESQIPMMKSFHVEAKGWDGLHIFSQLQPVQNAGLASCIHSQHQDFHFGEAEQMCPHLAEDHAHCFHPALQGDKSLIPREFNRHHAPWCNFGLNFCGTTWNISSRNSLVNITNQHLECQNARMWQFLMFKLDRRNISGSNAPALVEIGRHGSHEARREIGGHRTTHQGMQHPLDRIGQQFGQGKGAHRGAHLAQNSKGSMQNYRQGRGTGPQVCKDQWVKFMFPHNII